MCITKKFVGSWYIFRYKKQQGQRTASMIFSMTHHIGYYAFSKTTGTSSSVSPAEFLNRRIWNLPESVHFSKFGPSREILTKLLQKKIFRSLEFEFFDNFFNLIDSKRVSTACFNVKIWLFLRCSFLTFLFSAYIYYGRRLSHSTREFFKRFLTI